MAKFSIAPAQIPRTAGEGTLISSGITGVVSAYTKPGEGLGHRAGVLRGPIQDPACGLPRIPLPRTWVNRASPEMRQASWAGNITSATTRTKGSGLGRRTKRVHRRREQGYLQALHRGSLEPDEPGGSGRDLRPLLIPPARRTDPRAWPRGREALRERVPRSLPRLPHQHQRSDRRRGQGDGPRNDSRHPPE